MTSSLAAHVERQISHLKILSRLLGHELHAQNGARLSLSREELVEMQTSIDLFIEEMQRVKSPVAPLTRVEAQSVRSN